MTQSGHLLRLTATAFLDVFSAHSFPVTWCEPKGGKHGDAYWALR